MLNVRHAKVTAMIEIICGILALLSGGFCMAAAMGALRFPDVLTRMHAASKVATMGGALALLAAALNVGSAGAGARAVLGIVFLWLTAPIAAHLLGRAAAWRAGKAPAPPKPLDHRE